MTAQVVRFSRPYCYLQSAVEDGTLGKLISLSLYRRSTVPAWRSGTMSSDAGKNGGCMIDLAIHDVDFLYSLLGEPDSVNGRCHPANVADSNDHVAATLAYGKTLVTLHTGFYTAEIPFSEGYLAIFENGYLEYDAARGLTSCGHPLDVKDTLYPDGGVNINITLTSPFIDELSYFIDCVKQGIPPSRVLPESTAGSLALAERIIAEITHS